LGRGAFAAVCACLWLAACGSAEVGGMGPGESAQAPEPAGQAVTIAVRPGSASLAQAESALFAATVTGTADTAVTWSLAEGSAGGTVSATGLYTAPAAPGTYHVVVRSVEGGVQATATVVVTAAVPSTPDPTFYVDADAGSDAAAGTSPAAAWRTLARVNSAALLAGQVVAFKRGATFPGQLIVRRAGNAGSPIVFTAYGTGERPILDAGGAPDVVQVTYRASHVTIDGLLLRNAVNAGVSLEAGAQHVRVSGCEITATGAGVSSADAYNTITGNHIHDLKMIVSDDAPDNDYGAMGVNLANAHYNEVSYNRFVRCRAPSVDYGFDGGAIELWESNTGVSIHHNRAEGCNGFVEVGGTGSATVSDVTLAYNVIVGAHTNALNVIHLSGGNAVGTVRGLRFENNTVAAAAGVTEPAIWFSAAPAAATASYRNNLFVLNPGQPAAYSGRAGFTHDHNLFWRTSGTTGSLGLTLDATDLVANPLLVNLDALDLHLASGSPAVRAGTPLGHALDFDGQPVPADRPDVGAYQRIP